MKAVVYHAPRNVSVDEVPDAKVEKPTDALVRITATNICGSDLHVYEGRTDFQEGRVSGHENVGEVIGVGDAVDKIKPSWIVSHDLPLDQAPEACTSTPGKKAGRRLSCTQGKRPDLDPWVRQAGNHLT